ncbi:UDP-N-acetyl-alpha-D-glucosamine C6 dehydratase [Defluviimonas aquaemixtae]|uniref:UDP-N-acetyl-alpha-D-glucosamine C6 dehydratase n=1 Tax=Albidovulum aquaemixtae TaxID=1542388 RepID=A0A2R8B2M1_9RHOB|nr:nucleoside-diphosphate sugar epimerase/dehydratase [Defluviimonas aquaemixtae]SPH16876.1 UDP-N-acetyl-alpha-D-glucosamine C6 dehydratase [Defluviimonas aquaemixtae]
MVKLVLSMTRAQKRLVLLFFDIGFVPVAFLAASVIQYSTITPIRFVTANWPLVPLLMVASFALSFPLRTAEVRLKYYDMAAAQKTALFAAILGAISAALATIGALGAPAGFHVIFGLVFFALCAGSRICLLHLLLAIYRQSAEISRVLIYGAGRTGMALAAALRSRTDILPIAFVDDNATLRGLIVAGLPVYSGAHVERILAHHRIDRVILAMPSLSIHKQNLLSSRMAKLGLEVQTMPAFAQLIGEDNMVDKLMPAGPSALLSRAGLHDEINCGCDAYRDANVMITGAGGSIGLELCRQVIACRPARVVLFELSEVALYNAEMEMRLLTEGLDIRIVPVLGSVGDGPLVERVLTDHRIDVVLHAAAYKHVPLVEANARAGIANNALATAALAQKVRACGVGRFVLVSSDKAVRPASVMGATKRIAELVVQGQAAQSTSTVFSIVRFGNVLGSSGSVIPLFQEQIAAGGPVTLTDEAVTRYFMTIQEAARLVLIAGSLAEGGEVFVLDMGAPLAIRELARRLIEMSGYTVRDAANPDGDIEIVITGLRPGEKLHEELMVSKGAKMTAHPKIISVREAHLSELELAALLRDLRDAVENCDEIALTATLRRWIAEYELGAPIAVSPAQQQGGRNIVAGE